MGKFYFSMDQIAIMAMDVEVQGVKFYASLARYVQKQELKDMFTTLAQEEMHHREDFLKIAQEFAQSAEEEYSIDIATEIQKQLKDLTESSFDSSQIQYRDIDLLKALDIAVGVEARAVLIYTKVLETVTEKFAGVLTAILEEEKKHYQILSDLKKTVENS